MFAQLVDAVPFYEGLTLEELGGHGVRWPERRPGTAGASGEQIPKTPPAGPVGRPGAGALGRPAARRRANGALRLGTYRPIWASPEAEISPALHFLIPGQQLELSPRTPSGWGSPTATRCRWHRMVRG